MWIAILVLSVLAFALILYLLAVSPNSPFTQESSRGPTSAQTDWLKKNGAAGISVTRLGRNCFAADTVKECLYVSNRDMIKKREQPFLTIGFDRVLGSEVFQDDQTVSKTGVSIGGAIIGGLAAGGLGAIVGASSLNRKTTSKKQVSSFKAVLYLDDFSLPRVEFPLIASAADTDTRYYHDAQRFADELNATVRIILSRRENDGNTA